MPSHKTKTLSYRRAVWIKAAGTPTLEQCLISARAKLKTINSRTFEKNPGSYLKGLTISPVKAGSVLIHIAAETPGDHTSILKTAQDALEDGSVVTAAAPAGAEFMDGDVFIYCRNDELCICSSMLRESSVSWYFKRLFEAARLGAKATNFELQRVPDAKKISLINQEGVKEIQLGLTLYDATLSYGTRKDKVIGALHAAARHISANLGSDRRPAEDNLKVGLVVKTDDRMTGGITLGRKRITGLAKELIKGDDAYTIVTRQGKTISSDAINLRKSVEIRAHGKSVDRNGAWYELKTFYDEIVRSGIVEI